MGKSEIPHLSNFVQPSKIAHDLECSTYFILVGLGNFLIYMDIETFSLECGKKLLANSRSEVWSFHMNWREKALK